MLRQLLSTVRCLPAPCTLAPDIYRIAPGGQQPCAAPSHFATHTAPRCPGTHACPSPGAPPDAHGCVGPAAGGGGGGGVGGAGGAAAGHGGAGGRRAGQVAGPAAEVAAPGVTGRGQGTHRGASGRAMHVPSEPYGGGLGYTGPRGVACCRGCLRKAGGDCAWRDGDLGCLVKGVLMRWPELEV